MFEWLRALFQPRPADGTGRQGRQDAAATEEPRAPTITQPKPGPDQSPREAPAAPAPADGTAFTVSIVPEDGTVWITRYTGKDKVLVIPDTLDGKRVSRIGNRAFQYCHSLTSVTLPDSVTAIGDDAFSRCKSLTAVTLPDSVTAIGDYAFSGCDSLTSVTLPDSVTAIGDYAFASCDSLTAVTIPDSVTRIGANPFGYCSKLTEIRVSPLHPALAVVDGVLFSRADKRLVCFPCAFAAKHYVIPRSVKVIGNSAFASCDSLTSVTLPDSVTAIGNSAFYRCSSLTSITIPDSVTAIGDHAFSWCSNLTSITLPDSVTSIGDHAFYGCTGLTAITLPDSVTDIGANPFERCSNLTEIRVSPRHPALAVIDGVLFSKADKRLVCFPCAFAAKHYVIPRGVKVIGNRAFACCTCLTDLTIPGSVTAIGDYMFSNCSSLTDLTIPASVTSIGHQAFSDCPALTLTVPRGSFAEQYCKDNGLKYTSTGAPD